MFRRDHSSTDAQFVLIEKNPESGEIVEEPLLDSTISSSPSKEPTLSVSPLSISSSANSLGLKIRDKISKNIKPVSYLNALTTGSLIGTNNNTDNFESNSPNTGSNAQGFTQNNTFSPSSPGSHISQPVHLTPQLQTNSLSSSPASSHSSSSKRSNNSSPVPNQSSFSTCPPKEMLEMLAKIDPTNERLTGMFFFDF